MNAQDRFNKRMKSRSNHNKGWTSDNMGLGRNPEGSKCSSLPAKIIYVGGKKYLRVGKLAGQVD